MKTLLLMRHAKSSWKEAGLTDHERPLNARGRMAAPRMARWLIETSVVPEMIVCSTALRAKTTAEMVADVLGQVDVVPFGQLYLSDESTYCEVLQTTGDEVTTLLLVGHNPTMEYLTTSLTGVSESFPTGAIAHLAAPIKHWHELRLDQSCELRDFCRPRELEE